MKIYHGHASNNVLESCREAAPSHDHRVMLTEYLTDREDVRYAIDNGAFKCWEKNESWYESGRAQQFVDMVKRAKTKPRLPDFIVLPDVVMDAEQTRERTQHWIHILKSNIGIDTDFYFPCQNGMTPDGIVKWVDFIGADGIFVGGDLDYKHRIVPPLTKFDYPVHVGRPGDLLWAKEAGANSVDTASIAFDQSYHRLERLEHQSTL